MLVVTLGDPFSVSIECLLQLRDLWQPEGPVVFVGSSAQWQLQGGSLSDFRTIQDWSEAREARLYFKNIDATGLGQNPSTLSEKERGRLATDALEALRSLTHTSGKLAVVTAPIDKHAAQAGGFQFPGQTEYFCDLWQAKGIMILAGSRLRVALATNHLPLAAVTAKITEALLVEKIGQLRKSLIEIFGIPEPRIAVAALNPHAGDQGLFGDEDQKILTPTIMRFQAQGWSVAGPKPADTVFYQAYQGEFDGVLAMYHDQGLAPLKALHFYDAVNVSGGLPHLRVSPDHGPASPIYGQKLANPESFRQSLKLARAYLGWS